MAKQGGQKLVEAVGAGLVLFADESDALVAEEQHEVVAPGRRRPRLPGNAEVVVLRQRHPRHGLQDQRFGEGVKERRRERRHRDSLVLVGAESAVTPAPGGFSPVAAHGAHLIEPLSFLRVTSAGAWILRARPQPLADGTTGPGSRRRLSLIHI